MTTVNPDGTPTSPRHPTSRGPAFVGPEDVAFANATGAFFFCGKSIKLDGVRNTDRASFSIFNPDDSEVEMLLFAVSIYSTVDQHIYYFRDATFPIVEVHKGDPMNFNFPTGSSKGEFRHSTSEPTGGVRMSMESWVGPSAPLALRFPTPIVLPPNSALVADGSTSTAQTLTVNAYWAERKLRVSTAG